MSKVLADTLQLGSSATATQNLVIRTNKDGTFTLARGNAGATTQDILTIDANGRIAMPQFVAFSAYQTVATSVPVGGTTKLSLGAVEFDTGGYFSTTNSRFLPLVAGYYLITGAVSGAFTASPYAAPYILKNGAVVATGPLSAGNGPYQDLPVQRLIYLNGSTDYVELGATQSGTVSVSTTTGVGSTYLQGYLVAKS